MADDFQAKMDEARSEMTKTAFGLAAISGGKAIHELLFDMAEYIKQGRQRRERRAFFSPQQDKEEQALYARYDAIFGGLR